MNNGNLIKALQDTSLTVTERKRFKALSFPHLYGSSLEYIITYCNGRAGGRSELIINVPKQRRKEGRVEVFKYLYGGRPIKYLTTKIKKGAGKGRTRVQKIKLVAWRQF